MTSEKLFEIFAERDVCVWLEREKIKTDTGLPLDFRNHAFMWDIYRDLSPKQAISKAAQVTMCLSPKTKVLKSDLIWEEIEKINVGDKLVSVDENSAGLLQGRRKRVATVEAKNEVFGKAYSLTLEDGRKIVATENHRFLAKKRNAVDTEWRIVKDFAIGDQVRHFCKVWGEGTHEDGWMGGIIDGEGSMSGKYNGSRVTIVQAEGVVLERIKKYFSQNGYLHRVGKRDKVKRGGLGDKHVWDVSISNTAEIYEIIGKTRPSRFVDRTDWWEGRCIGRDKNNKAWITVTAIKELAEQRMIDIQTSTKTFIAEGIVSHNSTCAILKAFWVSRHKKVDLIYTLPTEGDRNAFVGGKVNRLIAQNPILQSWVKDKDSIEQKQVGENLIHFRGTWTSKSAIMVPSDLNIYDEVDASKADIIEQYATRLQHSKMRWEWFFSHPSAPDFGVDRFFQKSDKKHWFIKCGCGEEQFLDWPDSIDQEKGIFVCKVCRAEITDDMRRKGEWKKTAEGEYSGYWIPLLICPWVSAKEIIGYYENKSEEYFYNKVLGRPFVGAGNKLTWQAFSQNLKGESRTPNKNARVILGIDTGLKLDYVLGDSEGLFWHAEAKGYDELDRHMERWPNAIAIIDAGGDLIGSRQFFERWRGRVFLCHLSGDRKTLELIQWKENEEYGNCIVDRYRIIQLVVDEFGKGNIPVWGTETDWADYFEDWKNLTRIKVMNPVTGEVMGYKWVRSGRDHRAAATWLWRVGMDKFGFEGEAEVLNQDPIIDVPVGPEISPYGTAEMVLPDGRDPVNATLERLKDLYGD